MSIATGVEYKHKRTGIFLGISMAIASSVAIAEDATNLDQLVVTATGYEQQAASAPETSQHLFYLFSGNLVTTLPRKIKNLARDPWIAHRISHFLLIFFI